MDAESIVKVAFILGLVFGSIMVLAVVYNFLWHKVFGLGGVVLVVFGSLLLGLSIWTSFEFSVGPEGKITAHYASDLGAKSAELRGIIEELRQKVSEMSQDVSALKKANPSATVSQQDLIARAEKEKAFRHNSDYTVLVFYKPGQQETGSAISDALLSSGFKSSATLTDLTESKKQLNANQAWVIYTSRGQSRLTELTEVLGDVGRQVQYFYEPNPSMLRNGDIQILLF